MKSRIAVTNLKVVKSNSFETLCMSANLVFDGVKIATINNAGTGGSNYIRALPGKLEALKECEAWAKTLPAEQGHGMELPMDLDFAVSLLADEQFNASENKKQFKKVLKKGGIFMDGKMYTMSPIDITKLTAAQQKSFCDSVRKKYPTAEIMIEMDEEVAFNKFCENVK